MIILLHILSALASLTAASILVITPSVVKLRVVYGLTAATLATGTVLVLQSAHMLQTCVTGLVYLGCMVTAVFVAQRRLAAAKVKIRK